MIDSIFNRSPYFVEVLVLNPVSHMCFRQFCFVLFIVFLTIPALGQSRRKANNAAANLPQGPIPVVSDPQARLLESLRFNSSLMNQAVKYSVYLPPDYYTTNRRYPVVYLLHGYSDNETGWVQFGEADRIADEGIKSGEIPPMIIVMPDAGVNWYMNDYQAKTRYEDMFMQEFIPHIDSTLRTRTDRAYRAVSGLSMGGHGSLLYAMHRPDLFGTCAALSAAVFTDESITGMDTAGYNRRFAFLLGPGVGQERLTNHWKRNSPLILAKSAPEGDLKRVRWWLDCGDDDFLTNANALLHIALNDRKISHEYRVRDGAHTWTYWRTGLPDALKFIGVSFRR
jgi:enterochelin esterase-like enzyme